jgi:hypothetical protein
MVALLKHADYSMVVLKTATNFAVYSQMAYRNYCRQNLNIGMLKLFYSLTTPNPDGDILQ